MKITHHRPVITWLLSGCLLVFLMVIIGGITRLTHSGLSMVEWKITGTLPPLNEAEWNVQFEKYKQSPEFRLINHHFTLADFKSIFWWEFTHRMLGRTIGFVFFIPFAWFLIRRKIPPGFLPKILLLLTLGFCQGLLGWIMVKSGLNKVPHVSHYLLAAHLAAAFTTFGFTFWFALDLIFPGKEQRKSRALRKSIFILLLLVSLQVVYGAFVAGLKAGLLFSNFPMMGGRWIAPEAYSMQPWWKNFIENGAGVQLVHRILALLIVAVACIIFLHAHRAALPPHLQKAVYFLTAAVFLQFLLGMLTLWLHVPVVIASLHQVGAFILFSATLLLWHRFHKLV